MRVRIPKGSPRRSSDQKSACPLQFLMRPPGTRRWVRSSPCRSGERPRPESGMRDLPEFLRGFHSLIVFPDTQRFISCWFRTCGTPTARCALRGTSGAGTLEPSLNLAVEVVRFAHLQDVVLNFVHDPLACAVSVATHGFNGILCGFARQGRNWPKNFPRDFRWVSCFS